MSLKLGAAQYPYLWDYSIEYALKHISDIGFKYVELMSTPPHIWPRGLNKKERESIKALFDKYELKLIALNPTFLDLNLASTNPGIREETVTQIKEQIDLAYDLGAEIVVIIAGKRHPLIAPSFERIWEEFAKEAVFECVRYAEEHNVIFGLENGPTLFIEKASQLKQIVEEVNSPYMKVVFDVANATMVEPILPAIDEVKEYIVHVHLSDTSPEKWAHLPIGMRDIDFQSIGQKLKEINFQGISIIELTTVENPDEAYLNSKKKLEQWGWRA